MAAPAWRPGLGLGPRGCAQPRVLLCTWARGPWAGHGVAEPPGGSLREPLALWAVGVRPHLGGDVGLQRGRMFPNYAAPESAPGGRNLETLKSRRNSVTSGGAPGRDVRLTAPSPGLPGADVCPPSAAGFCPRAATALAQLCGDTGWWHPVVLGWWHLAGPVTHPVPSPGETLSCVTAGCGVAWGLAGTVVPRSQSWGCGVFPPPAPAGSQ